jgi:hypothetical protein
MKVCIVGAGAIGGFIGTRLAASGVNVSAWARGATLAALQQHGWRLQTAQGLVQARATASADAAELGVQDLVVIAVKGPALPEVAPRIAPLLGPHTVVLPAMNGVPWWFCLGREGFGQPLASVDPGGRIAQAIALEHVVGCVVHASTATSQPGFVQHKMGQGLIVGEPGGGVSTRVRRRWPRCCRPRGLRGHRLGRRAHRHLVQAVGQSDDEPGERVHRRHHRPHAGRPAGARLLLGGHARGGGHRRAHRLPHRAKRPRTGTPSPPGSARSRPRCCRTSRPADRSSSTPSSARFTRSASASSRCRTPVRCWA